MLTQIILALFPITLIVILLAGVEMEKGDHVRKNFWCYEDAKNMQAVAAFFIVLHHLTQAISQYGQIDKGPINGMNSVGILFTSVFFFFSGYGLFISYQTKENYLDTFFRNRIMKILIPFVFTNWIYAIVMAAFSNRIGSVFDFCTSLMGFTLMNTNAWFLVEILLYYTVFYYAFKKCHSEKNAVAVLWGVSIAIIFAGLLLGHDRTRVNGHWFMGEWWYNTTMMFPAGILVARQKEKIAQLFQKKYERKLYAVLLLFCLSYLIEEMILDHGGYYIEGWFGLFHCLLSLVSQSVLCCLFLLLLLLLQMKCRFGNRLLSAMGTISLDMYLIHGIFRDYLSRDYYGSDVLYFLFVIGYSALGAVILHALLAFFHDCYKDWLVERKFIKENGYQAYTYEKMKRVKRFMWSIRMVGALLVAICIATVVSGIYVGYSYFVTDKRFYKQEMSLLAQAQEGDTVVFGGFNINTETPERETLTWLVVKRQGDNLLLVCDYAIPYYYNQQQESVTYETAMVRDVMNEGIIDIIFTDYEKPHLVKDAETQDALFLLSADQAEEYLDEAHFRVKTLGVLDARNFFAAERDKYIWWWLRDSNKQEQKAWIVTKDGEIDREGKYVNNASGGVRPAMWISVR